MSEFVVSGRFQTRGGFQEFEKLVEAPNEDVAVEHVYSQIGSQHGLKRRQIELDEVDPVEREEVAA
jgi:large subunit ribosomal protein LX